jgi:hypothetical protein
MKLSKSRTTRVRRVDAMSITLPRSDSKKPAGPGAHATAIPPLESGDRITRHEFLRRYEDMPGLKKAELIQGVVYVPSPVRHKQLRPARQA